MKSAWVVHSCLVAAIAVQASIMVVDDLAAQQHGDFLYATPGIIAVAVMHALATTAIVRVRPGPSVAWAKRRLRWLTLILVHVFTLVLCIVVVIVYAGSRPL